MTDLYCGDDDIFTGGLASLTNNAGVFSFFRCVSFEYLHTLCTPCAHLDPKPTPCSRHPTPYTLDRTPAGLLSVFNETVCCLPFASFHERWLFIIEIEIGVY